jgi:hypothetical protein
MAPVTEALIANVAALAVNPIVSVVLAVLMTMGVVLAVIVTTEFCLAVAAAIAGHLMILERVILVTSLMLVVVVGSAKLIRWIAVAVAVAIIVVTC